MSGQSHSRPPYRRGTAPRRNARDRPEPRAYRRFLRSTVAGVLIPGLGLIAAGRRRSGTLVLLLFLAGAGAAVAYAIRAGRTGLIRLAADAERVTMISFSLIAVAALWLLIAIVSFYLLEPRGLRAVQRLFAVVVVIAVASAVLTPVGVAARYASAQRDFIEAVFPDERDRRSLTIPEEATDDDPWAGNDRVNVLILGSDAGDGRDGTRADTIMTASINTQTGDTALFSLPRNLQRTPLPEGPLRDAYPYGFHGVPESEFWISSVYTNIPAQFPEYFDGIEDSGAEAMKLAVGEALGLDIDYYVMVNLDGFEAIVDALGGVTIDVPYRIPMGTQATSWGTCTTPRAWIEEGEQQLTGGEALWFARARCGPPPISDDYERMRRQRCLIGAIADQVNPFTLLTRYLQLGSATRDNITTDISRQRLEDFAELGLRVQEAEIRSLPFTNEIVSYHSPDFELMRKFVQDSLDPDDDPAPPDGPGPDGGSELGADGETGSESGADDGEGTGDPGGAGETDGTDGGDATGDGLDDEAGTELGEEATELGDDAGAETGTETGGPDGTETGGDAGTEDGTELGDEIGPDGSPTARPIDDVC